MHFTRFLIHNSIVALFVFGVFFLSFVRSFVPRLQLYNARCWLDASLMLACCMFICGYDRKSTQKYSKMVNTYGHRRIISILHMTCDIHIWVASPDPECEYALGFFPTIFFFFRILFCVASRSYLAYADAVNLFSRWHMHAFTAPAPYTTATPATHKRERESHHIRHVSKYMIIYLNLRARFYNCHIYSISPVTLVHAATFFSFSSLLSYIFFFLFLTPFYGQFILAWITWMTEFCINFDYYLCLMLCEIGARTRDAVMRFHQAILSHGMTNGISDSFLICPVRLVSVSWIFWFLFSHLCLVCVSVRVYVCFTRASDDTFDSAHNYAE